MIKGYKLRHIITIQHFEHSVSERDLFIMSEE